MILRMASLAEPYWRVPDDGFCRVRPARDYNLRQIRYRNHEWTSPPCPIWSRLGAYQQHKTLGRRRHRNFRS